MTAHPRRANETGFLRFDRPADRVRLPREARIQLHRTGRHRINRLLVMRPPDVAGPGNIRGHGDQVNNEAQGRSRCASDERHRDPACHGLWTRTELSTLPIQAPWVRYHAVQPFMHRYVTCPLTPPRAVLIIQGQHHPNEEREIR